MGYIVNNHIIVTGYKDEIEEVHKQAVEIFGQLATPLVKHITNGEYSFYIAPDGSKEGWDISDDFNIKRNEFKNSIPMRFSSIRYIEIQDDIDNRRIEITDTNI